MPEGLRVAIVLVALILTLAPYAGGTDWGIFAVPNFEESTKSILKWLGPFLLTLSLLMFVPFTKGDPTVRELSNLLALGYESHTTEAVMESRQSLPDSVDADSLSTEKLKKLASSLKLEPSFKPNGSIVKFYFDQLGQGVEQDAFNAGFHLSQLEIGTRLREASGDKGSSPFVELGLEQASNDLCLVLISLGIDDVSVNKNLSSVDAGLLRAKIVSRLRDS